LDLRPRFSLRRTRSRSLILAGSRSRSCGTTSFEAMLELLEDDEVETGCTGAEDEVAIGGVTCGVLVRGESDRCGAASGSDVRSSDSVLEADEVD